MKKLTAEKCRSFIAAMKSEQSRNQLSITSEYQLQALEIALPVLEQQEKGNDGWKLVPMELTDEMIRGIVPCVANSSPLSHDEYDYKGRNERFIKWAWKNLLELAPQPVTDPQIENEVWLDWEGGAPPVDDDVRVEYEQLDGEKDKAYSYQLDWAQEGRSDDIIAYRVIENDGRKG